MSETTFSGLDGSGILTIRPLTVAGAAQVRDGLFKRPLLLPVELRCVNHTASTNAVNSNVVLSYHRRLQVPVTARFRENREGGASPPRAQRCKEDG